jgi:hypothetical protein
VNRPGRYWLQTIALLVAAAGNAIVGVWALFTPRSFYDNFPGAGHHWVSVDGPYNEHLLVDVGMLSLALTLVLLAALWKRDKVLIRTASVAALVFAGPHLAYHASHLDRFSTTDTILEMTALAIAVVAPLIALITTISDQASRGADRTGLQA